MTSRYMFDLQGKVAVITGGTGNLGTAMCRVLAAYGCDVIVASRKIEKAQDMAQKLASSYGTDALGLEWEATDVNTIKDLAQNARDWKGHIDICINNAGGNRTTSSAHFLDRSDEDIRIEVEINLISVLYCCREFGKIMKAQGYGKIINIASIAGMIGRDRRLYHQAGVNENLVDYNASKGGVIAATRDLAALMAPFGVYVNCISPGGFEHGVTDDFMKLYSERTPIGFMGRTNIDINGAVLFLASAASDYVVGQNIVVDGGFTVWK